MGSRGWSCGSVGPAGRRGTALLPRLHVVAGADVVGARDFRARLLPVLEAGGPSLAVHLRGRGTSARRLHHVAEWLVRAAAARRVRAIVNDRVDVALAVGAGGVHLREDSLPPAVVRSLWQAHSLRHARAPGDGWIGRSIHSPAQVADFPVGAVDFFMLGAVYPTTSHPGRLPLGLEAVVAASGGAEGTGTAAASTEGTGTAVVAIGGITPERVGPVCAAGAWGVAVASGVWGAGDPAEAVARYIDALPPAPRTGTGRCRSREP